MQSISTCLWFDTQAEDAARFYCSVFPGSKLGVITHYPEGAPRPAGTVMTVTFQLLGSDFMALNGGPEFRPSPAFSTIVHCDTQREIDDYFAKLSAEKDAEQCGWLQDKFGWSWQIVPRIMPELLSDKDPQRSKRVTAALMKMKKLDIAELQRAYTG